MKRIFELKGWLLMPSPYENGKVLLIKPNGSGAEIIDEIVLEWFEKLYQEVNRCKISE